MASETEIKYKGRVLPASESLIALGNGRYALVDTEDLRRLSQYRWCVWNFTKSGFYVARHLTGGGGRYLHHDVLGITPCGRGAAVDHANCDAGDNRKTNLRLCTQSQNCQNRRACCAGTSGYKGVSWKTNAGKWRAVIDVSPGTQRHLGYYTSEEEAARAYDKAAIEHFGQFARTNFPREEYEILETVPSSANAVYYAKIVRLVSAR